MPRTKKPREIRPAPRMPSNFPSITYEIKTNQPIPRIRRNQDQHCLIPQENPTYPIHNKNSKTYNLHSTLDKMPIGSHIEIKDREAYEFAVASAQTYASRIRTMKTYPVQMWLRVEWHNRDQIGRIWRRG